MLSLEFHCCTANRARIQFIYTLFTTSTITAVALLVQIDVQQAAVNHLQVRSSCLGVRWVAVESGAHRVPLLEAEPRQ